MYLSELFMGHFLLQSKWLAQGSLYHFSTGPNINYFSGYHCFMLFPPSTCHFGISFCMEVSKSWWYPQSSSKSTDWNILKPMVLKTGSTMTEEPPHLKLLRAQEPFESQKKGHHNPIRIDPRLRHQPWIGSLYICLYPFCLPLNVEQTSTAKTMIFLWTIKYIWTLWIQVIPSTF